MVARTSCVTMAVLTEDTIHRLVLRRNNLHSFRPQNVLVLHKGHEELLSQFL